ncbi:hypothetical protein HN011_000401 [Eciton burchellii]|nr:hypothetical protein HN011_000401 [Eciton burchellii]
MDSRIENAPNDVTLKRDHDSVDDFEHLGHDSSPDDHSDHQQHQQQQPRLIDAPRVDDLLHIGDSFQMPESALPSALVADVDDIETKPVPATPPPSADFDKCEAMAQSSDPFQRPLDTVDPKLASMAFVETERFHHPTQFNDDDNDNDSEMDLQPPLLPVFPATTVKTDNDILTTLDTKIINSKADKTQPIGGFDDISTADLHTDQGKKRYESENDKPSNIGIDEDLAWNIKSSALPIPEKSPLVDFLENDSVPSTENKASKTNIMDDDSWNVVEKMDVKGREQLEPPTKPLPPLPKEAELLENTRQTEYDMSKDLLIAEALKKSPQRSAEQDTAKRCDTKAREPDFVCPRPASKKKEEIEIAPKEIFRDMGLAEEECLILVTLKS